MLARRAMGSAKSRCVEEGRGELQYLYHCKVEVAKIKDLLLLLAYATVNRFHLALTYRVHGRSSRKVDIEQQANILTA